MRRILLLMCLAPVMALAQSFYINKVSARQGLTNNDVVGLAQDKRGLLWMATEEGLNCYDGATYTHFFKPESGTVEGIAGNELSRIVDDNRQPVLWIGTQREGLTALNYLSHRFTTYRHHADKPRSLASNHITTVANAHGGGLWVATYESGVDFMNPANEQFTHYNTHTVKGLKSDAVWDFSEDTSGHLYLGHIDGGLSMVDIRHRTATTFTAQAGNSQALVDNNVRCVMAASNGIVYCGTDKGLAAFNPATRTFAIIPFADGISRRVYGLFETSDHQLLAGVEQGGVMVVTLEGTTMATQKLAPVALAGSVTAANELHASSVRCVLEDRNGNIWAGIWSGGTACMARRQPPFSYMPYAYSHPTEWDVTWRGVMSVATDSRGSLWVGTDGGGLNHFVDGRRVAVYTRQSGHLLNDAVQTAFRDSRGRIWWGIYIGGALVYDPATGRHTAIFQPPYNATTDVRTFCEWPGVGMVVGTSYGLFVVDPSTLKIRSQHALGNNLVRALALDGQNRLWVGFYDGGVRVVDKNLRELKSYAKGSGLPHNTVTALLFDGQHTVYAGTNDGLVALDERMKEQPKLMQRSAGLPNTHIRSLIFDAHHRLWIGTNHGLSCLADGQISSFTTRQGLAEGYFMDRAAWLTDTGELLFGSADGVCRFYPDQVMSALHSAAPTIHSLAILGDGETPTAWLDLSGDHPLHVSYNDNTLQVGFTVGNIAEAELFEYSYRLVGLDDTWHLVDLPGTITLRSLPPGDYVLELRSTLQGANESPQVARLEFTVRPPWWRSWWAYTIYVIFLALIIGAGVELYLRRIKAESRLHTEEVQRQQEQALNEERLRFFTNITHELRTPLTLILGPLDDLGSDSRMPEVLRPRLASITQSAQRLLSLVNQLLEFRKTETQNRQLAVAETNVGQLVGETVESFKTLNANERVTYRTDIDTDHTTILADADVVVIIMRNLLSNAAKYTPEGEIDVTVKRLTTPDADQVVVAVKDSGYGIPADALPHIFDRYYQARGRHQASGTGIGLSLARSLAELHEGTLTVESEEGHGSTFTLTLSAQATYPTAFHRTPTPPAPAAPAPQPLAMERAASDDSPVVLVVEDNADIRHYVAESLAENFAVLQAADGQQGWQQAVERIPDVIVTDIMMPVMDGMELLRRVKGDLRTSHIPVVMLTAKNTLTDKEEGYDAGADSYLTKPFSAKLLRARVANLLEARRRMTEALMHRGAIAPAVRATAATVAAPKGSEAAATVLRPSTIDERFLRQLNEAIETNINNPELSIAFLCEKFGMSQSSLYRKIKGLTGLSGNVLIRKRRLHHALTLMQESGFNVSEAAYASGFGDMAYFRQCFKDEYGMSATDYLASMTPR